MYRLNIINFSLPRYSLGFQLVLNDYEVVVAQFRVLVSFCVI